MAESNYLIKEACDSEIIVELWSKVRLPFEPKGWLLQMRNSLRSSLRKAHNLENRMLYALYVSDVEGYFDVENVLIYNVGSSAFSDLCRKGICFERKFTPPVQPMGSDEFLHYHQYCLIGDEIAPVHWSKGRMLALWKSIKCPPLRGNLNLIPFGMR